MSADVRLVQNFRGCRALVIAGPATATDTLVATLSRLGLTAEAFPSPAALVAVGDCDAERDIILIDGDLDEAPQGSGVCAAKLPNVPIIGLVGIAAPTRLKSLLRRGATAILHKPVQGAAVFSALFVGVNEFRRRRQAEATMERQERRLRARRTVTKAVVRLMRERGIDEDEAFRWLRRESMASRMPLEDICDRIVAQSAETCPTTDFNQHTERGR